MWFYSENGEQKGPVSLEVLKAKLQTGELAPGTLVWRDGMTDWLPASQVQELGAGGQLGPAVGGATGGAITMAQPGPLQPSQMPVPVVSNTSAVLSMIFSIIAISTSIFCGVTVILGVPGVILGHIALAQIKKSPVPMAGRGMAIAGLVMGYLCVAILVLVTIAIIAGFSVVMFQTAP
ncbi:MAG: GYF domain-containing protein [Verrucomicrobiota bacterium JB023]|nr:GYF domain-containing protein [Verrucomicrobiota bacterium JB023]